MEEPSLHQQEYQSGVPSAQVPPVTSTENKVSLITQAGYTLPKWIIIVAGLGVVIFLSALIYNTLGGGGDISELHNGDVQISRYTNEQIAAILQGEDREEIRKVVYFLAENPNAADQFNLFLVAAHLFFTLGNKEQGTFWYYIAQVRTRAYAESDPDPSASAALRSALQQEIGSPINQWVGSDFEAWREMAGKAIAYEKKLPYPPKPSYFTGTDEEWNLTVDTERAAYEKDFKDSFASLKQTDFEKARKDNNLYIGPWQERGEPLLTEWQ